jgi:hypothetical protein
MLAHTSLWDETRLTVGLAFLLLFRSAIPAWIVSTAFSHDGGIRSTMRSLLTSRPIAWHLLSFCLFPALLRTVWYDGAIMMAKTQITLETEMQRRARQRANDLGVSLAEYFRRLLARDLARPEKAVHVDRIFDLGASSGSDIASHKDSMIAEAFRSTRRKPPRR